jgi:hypothetical protein
VTVAVTEAPPAVFGEAVFAAAPLGGFFSLFVPGFSRGYSSRATAAAGVAVAVGAAEGGAVSPYAASGYAERSGA